MHLKKSSFSVIKYATIITIGDELLIGQTVDTNSTWMAAQLDALGIELRRRIADADTRDAIRTALDEELPRNDLLLLTGGLGPTADDITKPVLCNYFGGKLVLNEGVLAHVEGIFARNKRPMLDTNRRQAEVPDCCYVLFNERGTAPGMWFEKNGKYVASLPGVPFEMMHLMETQVLPRLHQLATTDAIVHRAIITAGEGESFVAERIKDLEAALPQHIHLAYLPQPGMVRLRLTGHGPDELQLIREVELRRDEMAARIDNIVLSFDDLPLEHILGKVLAAKGLMLGLAESCTGGYMAHRITQIMGSAQYFMGSIVCYQESVKEGQLGVKRSTIEKYCVVSEEVAVEMAEGARKTLKSDIGFGITGLLSGSPEDRVPVGTVCMAASREGKTVSKTFQFHQDRLRNKELAATHALFFIWKFIQDKM
jgi:nicotinamide-nucleotide amidase